MIKLPSVGKKKVVKKTHRKALSQISPNSLSLVFLHRARARPRTPAAPARLIARPPVAAGAAPVEVEVPEPEAELEVELLLEADLVWVAVEVKVSWAEETVEL